MATLPQIIEEDLGEMNAALRELLTKSEATLGFILDKGGFVVTQYGEAPEFDVMTLAALGAASFAATESIAGLLGERNFSSVYQQGDLYSVMVMNIDEFCLLTVIFRANLSAGAIKYYAIDTIRRVAMQLQLAQTRAPGQGLDLSMANLADPSVLFKRSSA